MKFASFFSDAGRVRAGKLLRGTSVLLLAAGVATLAYTAITVIRARSFQASELERLRQVPALQKPHAEPRSVANGDTIGEIEIPRLGLNAIMLEGDSDDVLSRGVGHVPETALPWQVGNVALAAHRDTIFRPLRNIRAGDTVVLKTMEGDQRYTVSFTEVVAPTDVQVLDSDGENELTLITCFPFYYVGHAPRRFIVHARQVER